MALTIQVGNEERRVNGRIEQIILLLLGKQRMLVEWQSKVTITLHCGRKPEDVVMDVTIQTDKDRRLPG